MDVCTLATDSLDAPTTDYFDTHSLRELLLSACNRLAPSLSIDIISYMQIYDAPINTKKSYENNSAQNV